jgi:hypothetical protein
LAPTCGYITTLYMSLGYSLGGSLWRSAVQALKIDRIALSSGCIFGWLVEKSFPSKGTSSSALYWGEKSASELSGDC